MILRVLIDDEASTGLPSEHGLSLYIETQHHKLLFDLGQSGLFLENAKRLGVPIEEVDLAILSHGHYDHGGGILAFLQANSRAPVLMQKGALGEHWARREEGMVPIGLDPSLGASDRVQILQGGAVLDDQLEIITGPEGQEYLPVGNHRLLVREGERMVPDLFYHEQSLVISEEGTEVLVVGCAHRGILNILHQYTSIRGRCPDVVIGGFHLNRSPEQEVMGIGQRLRSLGSRFYTGHCTGTQAYRQLREVMSDQIQHLSTGMLIEIP